MALPEEICRKLEDRPTQHSVDTRKRTVNSFSGKWHSTFGPMDLLQTGDRVQGTYLLNGTACAIEGEVAGRRLTFTFTEPTAAGEGWFELADDDQTFGGKWRPHDAETWGAWRGERVGFPGLWDTDFGLMRLVQDHDRVHGFYDMGGTATIDGQLHNGRFHFTYQEPKVGGEGWFELAPHGLGFHGQWHAAGDSTWRAWHGQRVRPQPGLTWLVVVEAPWQRFLAEKEYSFGDMLREFFARVPQVHIRHRFFSNEAGLKRYCQEVIYLAEPVVLVVATHGQPGGIITDGQTVALTSVVDNLRLAADLQHLHLSACLTLADESTSLLADLGQRAKFPITGYSTRVDWAASAIIEFTLLELMLGREMNSQDAVEQLHKLLPFAGDSAPPGSVFRPAGFRLVLPNTTAREL